MSAVAASGCVAFTTTPARPPSTGEVAVGELGRQRAAPAAVQPVDRALGAAHGRRDLARREPDDVTQHHDAALLVLQRPQSLVQAVRAIDGRIVVAPIGAEDLLCQRRAARAQVVDGGVMGKAQQPGEERHAALVVLDEDRHQLREDVLRDVLGLVLVVHDAAHVAVDVVRVAHVQESDRLAIALLATPDGQSDHPRLLGRLVQRGEGAKARGPVLRRQRNRAHLR
jgi:hypothetical protein